MECFGLRLCSHHRSSWTKVFASAIDSTHLAHILEDFLPTPAVHVPVVVVLLSAANTQRAIDAAGTAEKSMNKIQKKSQILHNMLIFIRKNGLCLFFVTFLYANRAADCSSEYQVHL